MSPTTPLVTIAIPTFRRLNYLKEATASALAQSYQHIEVLIGDDGPTTEIEAWARILEATEPRVRYQRNAWRLGLAGNWNALVDAASGTFITLIGDDDRLLPNFVERLVAMLGTDGAVAFSHQYVIDPKGRRLPEVTRAATLRYRREGLARGELRDPSITAWQNSIPMSAAVTRTSHLRRLRFMEDLNNPELDVFIRLAREGERFFFCDEYLAEYRIHPESETSAGLFNDRIVKYLIAIPTEPHVEGHKIALLAPMMVNGVSRCLRRGDKKLASELFGSRYFPDAERRSWRGRIYRLILRLPCSLGAALYRGLVAIRRLVNRQ